MNQHHTPPAALDRIAELEAYLGQPLDYQRDLAAHNPEGLAKFFDFLPLASHASAASAEELAVVQTTAMVHEDCGTCLQITINLALRAGVAPQLLRAIVENRPEELPEPLRELQAYARAVVHNAPDLAQHIEAIRERYGMARLTDLALAIAATRVFPMLKRGLGHAISCARLSFNYEP